MQGFYWLIKGVLAGCPRPGVRGDDGRRRRPSEGEGTEGDGAALDTDLNWLREQGVGAVLSMTETALPLGALARHGLAELHLPVDDLTAPNPDQFAAALAFIDRQRAADRAAAVHCRMGQGRTGTILAAYRIRHGLPVAEALRELRAVCPGAVGSQAQEEALARFAARRDWVV